MLIRIYYMSVWTLCFAGKIVVIAKNEEDYARKNERYTQKNTA